MAANENMPTSSQNTNDTNAGCTWQGFDFQILNMMKNAKRTTNVRKISYNNYEIIEQEAKNNNDGSANRMLVIFVDGIERLLKFAMIDGLCTVHDLLIRLNVRFQNDTAIKCMACSNAVIDFAVIVGTMREEQCQSRLSQFNIAKMLPTVVKQQSAKGGSASNVAMYNITELLISNNNYVLYTQLVKGHNGVQQQDMAEPLFTVRANLLIIHACGKHLLINSSLPLGTCYLYDLLQQAGIQFDNNTSIKCVPTPGPDFDIVVLVGISMFDFSRKLNLIAFESDAYQFVTVTSSPVRRISHNDFEILTHILQQNRKYQPQIPGTNSNKAGFLVMHTSGFLYFALLSLLRASYTVHGLLQAMAIPVYNETIVHCVHTPNADVDFVISVGYTAPDYESISRAEQYVSRYFRPKSKSTKPTMGFSVARNPNIVYSSTYFDKQISLNLPRSSTSSSSTVMAYKTTVGVNSSSLSLPSIKSSSQVGDSGSFKSQQPAVFPFVLRKLSHNNFEISEHSVVQNSKKRKETKVERNHGKILVLLATGKWRLIHFTLLGSPLNIQDLLKQHHVYFDGSTAIQCFAAKRADFDFVVEVGLKALDTPCKAHLNQAPRGIESAAVRPIATVRPNKRKKAH